MENSLSPNQEAKNSDESKQVWRDPLPGYGMIVAEYKGKGVLTLKENLETKMRIQSNTTNRWENFADV